MKARKPYNAHNAAVAADPQTSLRTSSAASTFGDALRSFCFCFILVAALRPPNIIHIKSSRASPRSSTRGSRRGPRRGRVLFS